VNSTPHAEVLAADRLKLVRHIGYHYTQKPNFWCSFDTKEQYDAEQLFSLPSSWVILPSLRCDD
jgi:hypothetical protein